MFAKFQRTIEGQWCQLQKAIDNLQLWADENSFEISTEKIVQVIFRKGGRLATNEEITLGNSKLKIVNETRYLGIMLQTTSSSFRTHIEKGRQQPSKAYTP